MLSRTDTNLPPGPVASAARAARRSLAERTFRRAKYTAPVVRWLVRLLLVLVLLLVGAAFGLRARYGGGEPFPEDRSGEPALAASALEVVADLEYPPGNVAVSEDGRIFFTFHPEAAPPVNVAEWVDGRAVPYPPSLPPELAFQSVLSLRIDRQGRLWALDAGHHGLGQPRLLAFDLATGSLVYRHDFPRAIAPRGSHLNDFQVAPDGRRIYIADASIFGKAPALVVHDTERGSSRRLLEEHESVVAEPYVPVVQGREMQVFGLFAIRPGVDSIALDRQGEWLYFAPVTNQHLYRVRTRDLDDTRLRPANVAERVERFAPKTMSDGITTDRKGNVYLSDLEHSAVVELAPDGTLRTLVKDPLLRWPDGFGFGPDGWLYVTCSALHHVIGKSAAHVRSQGPYQILRFKPGPKGIPGH